MSSTLAERLWANVTETPEGCLEYARYCDPRTRYGQISANGRVIGSHVAAWIVTHGPLPDGLRVLHRCDNPPCCNPEHLFVGTQQVNVDDMHAKGRARKAQGQRASNGRLTSEQVAEIRRRWIPGQSLGRGHRSGNTAELAAEFGISKQYVGQIGRGQWRKHA